MGPLLNPDPDLRCQTTPSIWALGSHQPVHLCYRNGSLSITSCSFLQVQTISSTLKTANKTQLTVACIISPCICSISQIQCDVGVSQKLSQPLRKLVNHRVVDVGGNSLSQDRKRLAGNDNCPLAFVFV